MSYMVIVAIMILLYIGLMHLSNARPNTIRHSWKRGCRAYANGMRSLSTNDNE